MLFLGIFLLACNNVEQTADQTPAINTEDHDVHGGELSLNNGAKWQADESTRNHVAKLNNEITGFNQIQNADIADYHFKN